MPLERILIFVNIVLAVLGIYFPNIFLVGLLYVLLICWAVLIIRRYRRTYTVAHLLNHGQVDRFLEEIEKDIAGTKDEMFRACLLTNRSAGLYYKGRWSEAIELLAGVNVRKLPPLFKALYVNNTLANLLQAQRVAEAAALAAREEKVLHKKYPHRMLNMTIRSNLAALALHQGDLKKCRELIPSWESLDKFPLTLASTHMLWGILELKDGHPDKADGHFTQALRGTEQTFIPEKIKRLTA